MPPQPLRYPVDYFLCDQVVLHFEHPDGIDEDTLAQWINDHLLTSIPFRDQVQPADPDSIIIFHSLVIDPETEEVKAISLAPMLTIGRDYPDPDEEIDALLKLILDIHDLIYAEEKSPLIDDLETGIQLISVSPNWLFGGTHHQSDALGGPASRPVQTPQTGKDMGRFDFSKAPADILNLTKSFTGDGVDVAILDTVPSKNVIRRARNKWPKHRLVQSLLNSKNLLSIIHADFTNWKLVIQYIHPNSPYRMRDHGLFVAGVLRDIAPKAKLYLYEVLNEYGVGSLESIAWGLKLALDDYKDRGTIKPLIFNCSLLLQTSAIEGGILKHEDPYFPIKLKDPTKLLHLTYSFERIIERIMESGRIIVAAAGNDGKYRTLIPNPGGSRHSARYPAAYKKVIGVGALIDRQPVRNVLQAASYSNLADLPSLIGYMTLGGEPGEKGMLGVFIHTFPDPHDTQVSQQSLVNTTVKAEDNYTPNKSGWAHWAGTSFATPVICGILALANSAVNNFNADLAIQYLNNSVQNSVLTTPESEKVIWVVQVK